MTKISIALLIPVHNGLSFTSKCLNGLNALLTGRALSDLKFNVIVIDDGSNDGTEEWIKSESPQTIILKGNGNLWWSGGINEGTRYAIDILNADYLLWWNNDITPAPDYFNNLEKILTTNPPDVAGSKIYYAHDPQLVWSMGGIFDTRSGRKFMTGMNQKDSAVFDQIHKADWLPGMGTVLHRSVIEKIGMLDDKTFPQYHGDSDFTFRAKLAGYDIVVFPQLKIWNDKSNSGLLHQDSFRLLMRSLTDIKSNYHFAKDVSFYHRFATSPLAYQTIAIKYCLYIGGFIKWRILNLFGIRKTRHSF